MKLAAGTTSPMVPVASGVRGGRVKLSFPCPSRFESLGNTSRCRGSIAMERTPGRAKVGSRRFAVKGGKTARVTIPLGRRNRALARDGGLDVRVRYSVRHVSGSSRALRRAGYRTTLHAR
jgi:hypothetical protein